MVYTGKPLSHASGKAAVSAQELFSVVFIGTLLELYWGRSELYWYGVATLLVRYWYVIATLLVRYRYVIGRRA